MAEHSVDKKPFYRKTWFWVIAIIIFIIVVANQGSNNTQQTGNTNTNNKIAEEQVIVVDYKVLHKEYIDNPIAADEKYKDKILKLTGPVDTIDREITKETYVTFNIDFLKNVRITFKKDEESKVAQLKKGQTITIKGKCTGTLLSTTVALKDCEIIE